MSTTFHQPCLNGQLLYSLLQANAQYCQCWAEHLNELTLDKGSEVGPSLVGHKQCQNLGKGSSKMVVCVDP